VQVNKLLNKDYLKKRFSDFNPQIATPSTAVKYGDLTQISEQTTHLSIVDTEGAAVSVTTTLNDNYGCRTVVGGAGFLLNNEMDDFSAKPGVPNLYGAIGGEANSIQPQKRPLSSMTPCIVTKDGKLFMVVGTPGGTTIITSVFQVITNVIDFNMNATEATHAKRFHSQWLPDVVFTEKNSFTPEVIEILTKMGHKINERSYIGLVETILVRPDKKLEGVADDRGDDDAVGY
jgi:gamma-glutamyltranspeptidase / glutathione hydrolase